MTEGDGLTVGIIIVITIIAIISTMTGLHRGIKQLSRVNMVIAIFLLAMVFILGPTLFLLNNMTHAIGDYFQNIVGMSLWLDAVGGNPWPGWWTIFYWAWWLAWAPFVGTFIARISKGRTIKEFVIGSLLAPTLVGIIWIGIFGGTAIHIEHFGGGGGIVEAVSVNEAAGFFAMLSNLPAAQLLTFLATISVCLWFITSSDSGTYVNGMLTSGGNIDPPRQLRVVWGAMEGAVAAILIISGGIGALRTASVVAGFPFMIVMFFMAYCWLKALRAEV
jgi:glycine betaine transporter